MSVIAVAFRVAVGVENVLNAISGIPLMKSRL